MPVTKQASRKLKNRPKPISQIRSLRSKYLISQSLLARLLDISLRSVSALESGSIALGRTARRFAEIKRLCDALSDVSKPAYIGEWLQIPNEMLGGLKPVEAIERGQSDLVWQLVEGLRTGSHL